MMLAMRIWFFLRHTQLYCRPEGGQLELTGRGEMCSEIRMLEGLELRTHSARIFFGYFKTFFHAVKEGVTVNQYVFSGF